MNLSNIIKENFKSRIVQPNSKRHLLKESVGEIVFNGNKFQLTVDTIDSPTKVSVRLIFKPIGEVIRASKADVTAQLQSELNQGLSKTGLIVNVDTQSLDENEIIFLISADLIKTIVMKIFNTTNVSSDDSDTKEI
jgi:hypothetical protein